MTYEEILVQVLGNKNRDFKLEPLTTDEIECLIIHCEREASKPGLKEELKAVYTSAIDVLKEHILH